MAELPPVETATVAAVYRAIEARRETDDRAYLGMSTFGTDCDRALWYGWRRAHDPADLDGRRIRLFETGHREEARIIADLRAAGIGVEEADPATGRQWAVASLGGHLRGHLDGRAANVPEAPKTPHVLECKTHNDKSFKALLKDGVEVSKPGHYRQMQFYMHHARLTRALYVAVNKNDDALYSERVRYDRVAAEQLTARAERIVRAPEPPPKLFPDPSAPAAYPCSWCPSRALCHEAGFGRNHCRTCLHASPIIDESTGGRWRCERFGVDLDLAAQMRGCGFHLYVPGLVPGEQIDADPDAGSVTYRLADGRIWTDAPMPRGPA